MLYITSFSELPLCLIENPYLSDLSIGNVHAFSDMVSLRPPATQVGSKLSNYSLSTSSETRFTSLRTFICGYIASLPTDWIQAMMENSTLSTTLRNLSFMCLFDETTASKLLPSPIFSVSFEGYICSFSLPQIHQLIFGPNSLHPSTFRTSDV
jgi:hypothetical protein